SIPAQRISAISAFRRWARSTSSTIRIPGKSRSPPASRMRISRPRPMRASGACSRRTITMAKTPNVKAKKQMALLEIKNLHVTVDGKAILNGLDLIVNPGEVHAIMGPNGSGKSTLAHVLAGKEDYEVTAGEVLFGGENMLSLEPDERAAKGLFLAFQ